jgi:hypothetical protein
MDYFSEYKISFTVFVVSVFGNNGLWDNGNGFVGRRQCRHFYLTEMHAFYACITSARRTPGKLIDTRQNLQSIQPTFPETGILFYSTGALSPENDESSSRALVREMDIARWA